MPVTSSVDGKTVTISISGRFSVDAEFEFHWAYKAGNRNSSYIINLRDAKIGDTSLLVSAMLLLREHAGGDKADIIVTDPPSEVSSVLELLKFRVLYGELSR